MKANIDDMSFNLERNRKTGIEYSHFSLIEMFPPVFVDSTNEMSLREPLDRVFLAIKKIPSHFFR
jgi:hypothetical protein